jgi:hypothetical protein
LPHEEEIAAPVNRRGEQLLPRNPQSQLKLPPPKSTVSVEASHPRNHQTSPAEEETRDAAEELIAAAEESG